MYIEQMKNVHIRPSAMEIYVSMYVISVHHSSYIPSTTEIHFLIVYTSYDPYESLNLFEEKIYLTHRHILNKK